MPSHKTPTIEQRLNRLFDDACMALAPLADGGRLVLGCSAGGDSMALLDLAAGRAARRGWALAVAHFDHAQRPESADEAAFVRARAAHYGLEVFCERLELENVAAAEGGMSEDAMRQARHAFFARVAADWRATALLLAHQADDRAETFLIRLLAGAGPTGLAGVRPLEQVGELTIARPLLGARRAELRDYLRARGLDWRDDPTNEHLAAKRGWVRHALVPLMRERIGYDPTPRIARAAELIEEEAAVLGEAARLILDEIALTPDPLVLAQLDVSHRLWREAGPHLRRQLLREWLWRLREGPHPPGYEAVAEALAFIEKARPGAELRTVERIHLVHCRQTVLAFAPAVDPPTRSAASEPWLNNQSIG